jgi:toxin ParE1/3/4
MNALIFAPRAARDIDEIYEFTAEQWGAGRAESHIASLRQRCESLARGEITGRDAGHIRSGYRRVQAGSHVIFSRTSGETVEIVRILHARMDFGRHL